MVEYKDRGYISPSEANLYIYDPCLWVITYPWGVKDEGRMPAAWRGNAVEKAVDAMFRGETDLEALTHIAVSSFLEQGGEESDKQFKAIPGFVETMHNFLQEAGWDAPDGMQSRMERHISGFNVMGIRDYVWPEFVRDLKTTERSPSFDTHGRLKDRDDHIRQMAAYVAGTNSTAELIYCTPKKVILYPVSTHEIQYGEKYLTRAMELISQFDERDIRNWVPKNLWDYRWGPEQRKIAKETWGL